MLFMFAWSMVSASQQLFFKWKNPSFTLVQNRRKATFVVL